MNDLDLEKSRALDAAATPAPWSFEEISEGDDIVSRGINGPDGVGLNTGVDYEMFSKEDVALITYMRNSHMDLIAEIEALRDRVAELEEVGMGVARGYYITPKIGASGDCRAVEWVALDKLIAVVTKTHRYTEGD